jgi:hypothetical protein
MEMFEISLSPGGHFAKRAFKPSEEHILINATTSSWAGERAVMIDDMVVWLVRSDR